MSTPKTLDLPFFASGIRSSCSLSRVLAEKHLPSSQMKPPPRSASMNVFSALMLFQITVVASEYYWNCEPDYNSCILNQTITTNTKWPNSDPKAMSECNQNCFGGYYRCSNITGECVKTNAGVNQTGRAYQHHPLYEHVDSSSTYAVPELCAQLSGDFQLGVEFYFV